MMTNTHCSNTALASDDGSTSIDNSPPQPTHEDACNSFFEHAAHHNADGVVSLQKGDCGRAFHSFVTTLGTLHKFRNYQMSRMEECTTPPASLPPSPPTTTKHKNCKAISVPYLEDSGFFIYNNAVIFSRKPRIVSEDPDTGSNIGSTSTTTTSWQLDTIAFCEAVTQFNLGLAYHQRGKFCGEDKTLLGALELYEQALATLKTIQAKASEETTVLQLAVMNNRIHILNEIARYPSAQLLVNDLLLQSVNALSNNDGDALSFLTRGDIDNFLLNALVIRRFNTAPCA